MSCGSSASSYFWQVDVAAVAAVASHTQVVAARMRTSLSGENEDEQVGQLPWVCAIRDWLVQAL
jgi:hypothetical protein